MFFSIHRGHRFIDRGDPTDYDFLRADFTTDGTWRALDLSTIVPKNAIAVIISLYIKSASGNVSVNFRKKGNSNERSISRQYTQALNQAIILQSIISLNTDAVIEYKIDDVVWDFLNFSILGWFV